ncbi:protein of unknown function [Pseudorhizobium banfieldiae]|uniref:Uncharacterized protein n=1 Tax=Pseudorhizobium banfieldiae TaxID=1125847 RepID=L0NFM6_9HYPH|nr:hypothetical protein [Pseudorhizobium banfieldiae]CAD6605992.1 hypothetical protein RNT25_01760 [arsenite-oxidising bacterium NT-25]CCF19107.1 protein of unknown function [Pseudorhizobium banfieldiae]
MSTAPGSYFVFDPGRTMGFAYCLAGGEKIRHGTWRFNQKSPGAAYAEFITYLKRTLTGLPDPLVGIELMTIVDHGQNGKSAIDAQQVMFSSGWPTHAQTLCHTMGLREPELMAISTWRSKTHGKMRVPDNMKALKQAEKSKWLKLQAKLYCDKNGWSYNTEDEAEALCMLDALRIIHEPDYAFDKGRSFQQESFL